MAKQITDEDRKNIREYLLAIKELGASEPECDYSNPESVAAWDKWNSECISLTNRYKDSITRALLAGKASGIKDVEQYLTSYLNGPGEGSAPDAAHIPQLKSTLSRTHIIPNNKLTNTLTKIPQSPIEIVLDVAGRGAKNKVTTTCILSYDGDNVKISGKQPFTEFDRNVYNAVVSLYVAGNTVVTPAMVYRAMTGMSDTEYVSPKQIDSVTHSLDKMRFLRARIDCSEEFKMRQIAVNGKRIAGLGYDDNLLHLSVKWVKTGGVTISAYEILSPPILYQYSNAVKQILRVPSTLLDVKELDSTGNITDCSLANTESRIQIKGYLLRRIEGMKANNGLNNPVVALSDYERDGETHRGLYSIAGTPTPSRTESARIRADVERMLSYWQAVNHISGYEIIKEVRKITGYKISV